MKVSKLLLPLLISLLTSCSFITGEEVARLPINQLSTDDEHLHIAESSLDLKKDEEIAFWSDVDIDYQGGLALRFKVEILKDGAAYANLELDPTDKRISLGEVKTSFGDKTSWSFEGKNAEITIEEDAHYTFRAILVAAENPSLVINKAELVLKK